ncbi:Oxysterol-binding protein-related protein 1 [Apodemus speciosus]|uniref:Oxysterol-binding protein n=1 Tax=Apodemus speciosus TaxID=105296 RepID=A0ABQ0FQC6_APOSI
MNTEAEQQLLHHARNGNAEEVRRLLEAMARTDVVADIDCKEAGAKVNMLNDMGDTPLHRAAFTGRKELVLLLLEYNADTTVVNGSGQTAKEATHDKEIRNMLEAVERTQQRKLEELLLGAAREGRTAEISALLSRPNPPDVNCSDQLGNTPLHCAAYRAHKQCVLKLLRSGADPSLKNKNETCLATEPAQSVLGTIRFSDLIASLAGGPQEPTRKLLADQKPLDLAHGAEMKHILIGNKVVHRALTRYEGPLWKSSRFFGWKLFWVVLEHGVLSWYRKQPDAVHNSYRQGCKHLTQAVCTVKPTDSCLFSIRCFDDTVHSFRVPKNSPQQSREKWLEAIEEHSAYSTHYCSQDQVTDDEEEDAVSATDLKEALARAQTCQQRLDREIYNFLKMIKECDVAKDVRNFKLEQEQEKNKILSEALETLATEHHELERSLVEGSPPVSILSEDEFYDALSGSESEGSLTCLEAVTAHSFEENEVPVSSGKHRMSEGKDCGGGDALSNGIKKHRNKPAITYVLQKRLQHLEHPEKMHRDGELSKITMPVIFNEPLSFLQRLTEYMEHTYLIHKASSFSDPVERMQCVAAFAVSAVASQWERTGKPFNPLLGETYELVRDDLGFRLISEQVSHHPPISAFHAEGLNNDFIFHGSIYPKLKFWGKSVEAEPKGTITLELLEHNEAYTWTNPTCCVHNIIVGKLWIEQYGNVEIINHKTGDKCVLNFKPCGLFGKELHRVEGYIQDKSKKKLCALYGKWTECLYSVDPATFDAYKKNDKKNTEEKKNSKQTSSSEESDEMPVPDSESVFIIPGSVLLWRIAPRPPNSAQMYNFTSFAMVLNEVDKEMESVIPKTDCRLRPDIRAMENGEIDQASEEKKRLEEKQRAARKNRSKSEEDWKTRWFHQGPNPYSGAQDWIYSGSYWDRNYFNLPDIY